MQNVTIAAPFAPGERERIQSIRDTAWIVQHVAMTLLGLLLGGLLCLPLLLVIFGEVSWRPTLLLYSLLLLVPLLFLVLGIRGLIRRPAPLPELAVWAADGQIQLLGRRLRLETHPVAGVTPHLETRLGEPTIMFDTPRGKRAVQLRVLADPHGTLVALGLAPR